MAELDHRYYCVYCHQYLDGATPGLLSLTVNAHTNKMHPAAYSSWTSESITGSSQYSGPAATSNAQAMERYKVPYGSARWEWGTAQSAPKITAEDRELLKRGLVKWD